MNRGGKRTGAGRPPKAEPTKPVRIPLGMIGLVIALREVYKRDYDREYFNKLETYFKRKETICKNS